MNEFITAALPWVLAGIAVAVLCVGMERQESERAQDGRMALGLALGLLLGVMLNGCGLWENHAVGLALGPLWGMALASLHRSRNSSGRGGDQDPRDQDPREK